MFVRKRCIPVLRTASQRIVTLATILFVLSAPAKAEHTPDELLVRLEQGIEACLAYYQSGISLKSLERYGFSFKKAGARIKITLPNERYQTSVRVFTEGYNNLECETHTSYTRNHALKNAFFLTKETVSAAGFQTIQAPNFGSIAKTIFQKGTMSLYMKLRQRDNVLMIKFLRRTP